MSHFQKCMCQNQGLGKFWEIELLREALVNCWIWLIMVGTSPTISHGWAFIVNFLDLLCDWRLLEIMYQLLKVIIVLCVIYSFKVMTNIWIVSIKANHVPNNTFEFGISIIVALGTILNTLKRIYFMVVLPCSTQLIDTFLKWHITQ